MCGYGVRRAARLRRRAATRLVVPRGGNQQVLRGRPRQRAHAIRGRAHQLCGECIVSIPPRTRDSAVERRAPQSRCWGSGSRRPCRLRVRRRQPCCTKRAPGARHSSAAGGARARHAVAHARAVYDDARWTARAGSNVPFARPQLRKGTFFTHAAAGQLPPRNAPAHSALQYLRAAVCSSHDDGVRACRRSLAHATAAAAVRARAAASRGRWRQVESRCVLQAREQVSCVQRLTRFTSAAVLRRAHSRAGGGVRPTQRAAAARAGGPCCAGGAGQRAVGRARRGRAHCWQCCRSGAGGGPAGGSTSTRRYHRRAAGARAAPRHAAPVLNRFALAGDVSGRLCACCLPQRGLRRRGGRRRAVVIATGCAPRASRLYASQLPLMQQHPRCTIAAVSVAVAVDGTLLLDPSAVEERVRSRCCGVGTPAPGVHHNIMSNLTYCPASLPLSDLKAARGGATFAFQARRSADNAPSGSGTEAENAEEDVVCSVTQGQLSGAAPGTQQQCARSALGPVLTSGGNAAEEYLACLGAARLAAGTVLEFARLSLERHLS